jgi:3-dehydroquinate synthase
MRKVTLKLGKRSYDIIIGKGIIESSRLFLRGLNIGRDALFHYQSLIKGKYGKELSGLLRRGGFNFRFKTVSESERSKSLEKAAR